MLIRGLKIFAVTLFIIAISTIVIVTRRNSTNFIPPLAVFDDSTGFVVRVNNPQQFFQSFEISPVCEYFKLQFADTTSLPGFIPICFYEKSKELYFSYHPIYVHYWILSFSKTDSSEKWLKDFLKTIDSENVILKEKESGNTIYQLKVSENHSIGITENSGLIIFTEQFEACSKLSKAIAKLDFDPEHSKSQIEVANKLASVDAVANLFINVQNKLSGKYPFFTDNGWATFDVWNKNSTLLINGLSGGENQEGYLKNVEGEKPVKTSIEKIIPFFANSYYHLVYTKELPIGKRKNPNKADKFKKKYGIDIFDFIQRTYGGELVRFNTVDNQSVVGFKIKGESTTEFNLRNMIDFAIRQKSDAQEIIHKFDAQTQFSIYKSEWGDFTGEMFGEAFSLPGAKCLGIVSDFLFVAESLDVLRKTMNAIILQQSFAASVDYQKTMAQKASSTNISLFQQRGTNFNMLPFWISEKSQTSLQKTLDVFPYTILWQISNDLTKPYHNIIINFGQQKTKANKIFEWKSRLQGSSVLKPIIVKSHVSNESEIIVQDSASILYLLNRQGRILWQKQLDGPILSDVYQVDRYKNGFLQLLFNTSNKIYLVDRNGEDTDGYPLELKSTASTGLGLFDYDDNKNYRIAIPYVNHSVSLIDINGNAIEGWMFDVTDGVVSTPIQHFRVGTKDYLLLGDSLRIYILDRRGEQRIKPSELKGKSANNPFYYSQSRKRWFTTTTEGQLMSVSIDGTVRREDLFKLSSDHYYLYTDFSTDRKGNHIFIDDNQLIVADHQGKKMFSHVFRGKIIDMPYLYRFSSKSRGLGVVDRVDRKVFLFNSDGKQFPMFPQHGITPFTITRYENEQNFHLLVGHIDGFIYNIKID